MRAPIFAGIEHPGCGGSCHDLDEEGLVAAATEAFAVAATTPDLGLVLEVHPPPARELLRTTLLALAGGDYRGIDVEPTGRYWQLQLKNGAFIRVTTPDQREAP